MSSNVWGLWNFWRGETGARDRTILMSLQRFCVIYCMNFWIKIVLPFHISCTYLLNFFDKCWSLCSKWSDNTVIHLQSINVFVELWFIFVFSKCIDKVSWNLFYELSLSISVNCFYELSLSISLINLDSIINWFTNQK